MKDIIACILVGINVCIIIISVFTYPNWSYKQFLIRCEINAKHPKWTPYCGKNFLESDPQWFIDNGYEKYVRKKLVKNLKNKNRG